jgi:hypothetical protein
MRGILNKIHGEITAAPIGSVNSFAKDVLCLQHNRPTGNID